MRTLTDCTFQLSNLPIVKGSYGRHVEIHWQPHAGFGHVSIFIFSYIIVCTVNMRPRRQQITILRPTLICADQCGLAPKLRVFYVSICRLPNHVHFGVLIPRNVTFTPTHAHVHFHGLQIPSSFMDLLTYPYLDFPGHTSFPLL
jgi:hypothetical protein